MRLLFWVLLFQYLVIDHAWITSKHSVTRSRLDLTATEVGSCNIPGTDPDRPQKVNQDANFALQTEFHGRQVSIIGVLDGHGVKGHLVTEYLREKLPERLSALLTSNLLELDEEVQEALKQQEADLIQLGLADEKELRLTDDSIPSLLKRAFHLAHLEARMEPSIPTGRSGTTCVVVAIDHNTIYSAAVGDSSAILVTDTTVEPLTIKTTVAIESERRRIEAAEGRITGENVFYGPVGIAMTRALGDAVMLRAGVLPTPVLRQCRRPHGRSFVVVGTDGVFDVLEPERIAEIVRNSCQDSQSVDSAAAKVANEARQAWLADLPVEVKVDDITCVVQVCHG